MKPIVVMPTYNEAENILPMLEALASSVPGVDVLVVDDGSPDGTADLVDGLGWNHVTVLRRKEKSGLGGAYRAGFRWAIDHGYDAMVEMDADFSHDPASLPSLLAAAEEGADVVIGSRYIPGGSTPKWAWYRLLLSRGGNLYASGVLGLHVNDSTAGFRVYRSSILEAMDFETVRADGYGFQIEMTYRARGAGASIREVPIRFVDRERGESKMSSAIVVEALWMVTVWGVKRIGRGIGQLFDVLSRTPAPDAP